ncbi:MAG TPA: chromate transporter [Candidatus Riflebacteria bacterium]|jgi:chromate transporter|nr:chromate transporter [Candidatus Riflebacteria bacterium]
MQIYFELFISFFKIGLFGFGGGYAMLPLIRHEVAGAPHNWLSMVDFTDMVAISQITPGPVAINMATYVGYAVSGNIFGALLTTLGVCLPPLVIMLLLAKFYLKFRKNQYIEMAFKTLRPGILGLIAAAALSLMNAHNFIDKASLVIFAVVFVACLCRIHPIKLIILSGIAGLLLY